MNFIPFRNTKVATDCTPARPFRRGFIRIDYCPQILLIPKKAVFKICVIGEICGPILLPKAKPLFSMADFFAKQ
jgi:hypothetical protein